MKRARGLAKGRGRGRRRTLSSSCLNATILLALVQSAISSAKLAIGGAGGCKGARVRGGAPRELAWG